MERKTRKKRDIFNGMSEEDVCKLLLPDRIKENLDILIVGINPGMFSAYKGHHYAKPGNHFWKCLHLSGLTPKLMSAFEDEQLLDLGIGLTNIVERTTRGSPDLTRGEIKEGACRLLAKIKDLKPKIIVFNGKQIYEIFSGRKKFDLGLQPELVQGTNSTRIWVMPSSSGRCTTPARAEDKVPYYVALKKFRDFLNGRIDEIDEKEMIFLTPKMANKDKTEESVYFRDKSKANFNQILDKKDEPVKKQRKTMTDN